MAGTFSPNLTKPNSGLVSTFCGAFSVERLVGADSDEHQSQLQNQPAQPAAEPLHQLAGENTGRELVEAIKQLPLRQQQAFLLRVWEGFTVKETAKAMSCSDGSVKNTFESCKFSYSRIAWRSLR